MSVSVSLRDQPGPCHDSWPQAAWLGQTAPGQRAFQAWAFVGEGGQERALGVCEGGPWSKDEVDLGAGGGWDQLLWHKPG
jgi:hypothetical protein